MFNDVDDVPDWRRINGLVGNGRNLQVRDFNTPEGFVASVAADEIAELHLFQIDREEADKSDVRILMRFN